MSGVAEGVETVEQARWLAQQGCQTVQGYLGGRPVAPDTFERLHLRRPPTFRPKRDEI